MRIGGLASGMDIDKLVGKLMKAERMPLDRMEQERSTLTWKRDAFRDINKKLLELDNMVLEMKYKRTYNSKSVSSSQENAVTATGNPDAANGAYKIEVGELATSAINQSQEGIGFDANKKLVNELNLTDAEKNFSFSTFKENGDEEEHPYTIQDDESLNDLLKRISDDDNNVRAFYDKNTDKVIMETTRTGDYNKGGAEIDFSNSNNTFFTETLNMDGKETGGTDAKFSYNGLDTMTSHDNSYKLGGVTFQFNGKTDGAANINVTNDVEGSFDKIMEFVDKYNEVVDKLNGSQQEERYRDYKPLTDKQKEAMSEEEIELWEEKAKSGILHGESSISDGLFSMRNSWYSNVETGGDFTSLTQVGITTSRNYLDGGKLEVDETELKEALRNDPDGVYKLFSNDAEDGSRGIINRLNDSLDSTKEQIENRAGGRADTLENYTLGKRMKDLNGRIGDFEDRLARVENRYWNQFTQMEKAIQRMNQQSAQLNSQLGGM